MRIPACPLIVTLFAVALYLPTAIGQQPGAVNIRPRVATSQPGVPDVRATVDKHRVPLGKEVTFTLSPASVVMNSRYAVTIYFGDGTQQRTRQTQIVHCYCASGNYTYSVLVKSSGPPPTPTPTPSPSPLVPGVKLAAQPTSVTTTQTVNFAAQLSHSYPNIKYRFEFGDGSQTGWQERPQATHTYRSPDTYYTYVDIGAANYGSVKQVGGSERKPIQVTTPSQPPRPQPRGR